MPIFEADPEVGAVSGHCRALNADENFLTKIQDTWYEGQFSVRKAFESVFGAVTCVSGPLAIFRRSAIYNFMPAWQADTFLGQEFRFATDRTLTAYVLGATYFAPRVLPAARWFTILDPAVSAQGLEDRLLEVVTGMDQRAGDLPQHDTAAGPLEEELHEKHFRDRKILLAAPLSAGAILLHTCGSSSWAHSWPCVI